MSKSRISSGTSQKLGIISNIGRRDAPQSTKAKKSWILCFKDDFKSFCKELNVDCIPDIKIINADPDYESAYSIHGKSQQTVVSTPEDMRKERYSVTSKVLKQHKACQILIVCAETQDEINMVIYKHYPMTNNLLGALQKTCNMYQTVSVLKLEFCKLDHQQIKAVKFLLQQNPAITQLSLRGNPNKYQNFYILLKSTHLLYLSLSCCRINDRGVAKIAQCLSDQYVQSLFAINLASNFISDDGVQQLANVLRTNRCLMHLNLADNWLTDNSCNSLMQILQKFQLDHEEIVIRRKRNLANLMKIKELTEETKSKDSIPARNLSLQRKSESPRKSRSQNRRSSKASERISVSSASSMRRKKSFDKEIMHQSQVQILKDLHPLVSECYPENKEIYCRGNFTLSLLNLMYNKISADGLQATKEMLKYQMDMCENCGILEIGITKLFLEGNKITDCDTEMEEISSLLFHKSKGQNSFHRKSSSRSSRKSISLRQ